MARPFIPNAMFMKTEARSLIQAAILSAILLSAGAIIGCKAPKLATGGVYAPTNSVGEVVYYDLGLALTDASYKFAYETALSPLKFEKDNRTAIFALSPSVGLAVKQALDKVRAEIWTIDQRWAAARQAYKANPTPAGLSTLQTILAEIERIIPVVQSQLAPVYQVLATKTITIKTLNP